MDLHGLRDLEYDYKYRVAKYEKSRFPNHGIPEEPELGFKKMSSRHLEAFFLFTTYHPEFRVINNPVSRNNLFRSITAYGSGCWKSMIVTDLACKLLAMVVLTPLLTILLQWLLVVRGNRVLSDIDIAKFFIGPLGWLCAIVIGAMWLGILALEQASLLAICRWRGGCHPR